MSYKPELEAEIEDRAGKRNTEAPSYAIAYAILQLAEATRALAHAVEVVVGAELAGIGISIRERI